MMRKEHFLAELKRAITSLPPEEQNEILLDYEEYFTIGKQDGKTEEEIAISLGSPEQIGKELTAVHHVQSAEGSTGNFFRALWAVVGLGFFNLVIVLGPFIAIALCVAAGWIVAVSFTLAPIGVLLNTVIHPQIFELYNLFFSVGLAGVGLLIGVLMFYATNWLKRAFVQYFKFNVRMVKGGMKHA